MYEKFLDLTKQEIIGFTPLEGCQHLPDLTPRNLWDLCDMTVRFGSLGLDGFGKVLMHFAHRDLRIEVYNFIGNGAGGIAGMSIGKFRPGRSFQATEEGAFLLTLFNGMGVIWDRGWTVLEIKKLIHEIDNLSYAHDHIVGGRRAVLYHA